MKKKTALKVASVSFVKMPNRYQLRGDKKSRDVSLFAALNENRSLFLFHFGCSRNVEMTDLCLSSAYFLTAVSLMLSQAGRRVNLFFLMMFLTGVFVRIQHFGPKGRNNSILSPD